MGRSSIHPSWSKQARQSSFQTKHVNRLNLAQRDAPGTYLSGVERLMPRARRSSFEIWPLEAILKMDFFSKTCERTHDVIENIGWLKFYPTISLISDDLRHFATMLLELLDLTQVEVAIV
jgi:hypothetical protein